MIYKVMDIYSSEDYREIIKGVFSAQKTLKKGLTYQKMAEFMRIQKPYLSKVLNNYAEFNTDQLYKAAEFLGLDDEQFDYLNLLLERERSQHPDRKQKLTKRIKRIQNTNNDAGKKTRTQNTLTAKEFDTSNLVEFYLDPLISVVHVFLSIERYRKNPDMIASALSITKDRLSDILIKLESMEIITTKKSDDITILIPHLSLPRDSKMIIPYQKLMTQLCAQKKGDLDFSRKKSFNATFASTENARKKIEFEFLEFIEKVRKIATEEEATDCYQVTFDLFPWS